MLWKNLKLLKYAWKNTHTRVTGYLILSYVDLRYWIETYDFFPKYSLTFEVSARGLTSGDTSLLW